MLTQQGKISFVEELAGMVEEFLVEYEALRGPLRNDLERGLVIAYVLGVMRCDLDAIWDSLGRASVFGALHPRAVFEECVGRDEPRAADRYAAIEDELRRRGWLSVGTE